MPGLRRLGGSAAVVMTDQALSSLTNFVVLFAALRFLTLAELGGFTLAYNTLLVFLALVRPLSLEPFTVRFSAGSASQRDTAAGQTVGLSLALGLCLIIVAMLAALWLPNAGSAIIVSLSFAIAACLVQDAWRLYFLAAEKPWAAVLNDGICLLATACGLAWGIGVWAPSVASLLGYLAFGIGVGAVMGTVQTGILPQPKEAIIWLRSVRGLGFRFAGEVALDRLSAHFSLVIIGAISGASALGQVGGARTLMRPVNTMVSGASLFLTPEAARMHGRGETFRLNQLSSIASLILSGAVVVFTLGLLALPDSFGEAVVGANWVTAVPLLLPVGIWTAGAAAGYGPRAVLRALEKSSVTLRLAMVTSPLLLILTGFGSYYWGALGASWGFAAGNCLATLLWWIASIKAVKETGNPANLKGLDSATT